MNAQYVETGLKAILDEALAVAIGEYEDEDMAMPDELRGLTRVSTYEEEGILTRDRGLVIRTQDGGEYQVTILKTR